MFLHIFSRFHFCLLFVTLSPFSQVYIFISLAFPSLVISAFSLFLRLFPLLSLAFLSSTPLSLFIFFNISLSRFCVPYFAILFLFVLFVLLVLSPFSFIYFIFLLFMSLFYTVYCCSLHAWSLFLYFFLPCLSFLYWLCFSLLSRLFIN